MPESERQPDDPNVMNSYCSASEEWFFFEIQMLGSFSYYKLAKLERKEVKTELKEDKLANKSYKLEFTGIRTLEHEEFREQNHVRLVSNKGDVIFVAQKEIYITRFGETKPKKLELNHTGEIKELKHSFLLPNDQLVVIIDNKVCKAFDLDGQMKQEVIWNKHNKEESAYISEQFEIVNAKPFSKLEGEGRVGMIVKDKS